MKTGLKIATLTGIAIIGGVTFVVYRKYQCYLNKINRLAAEDFEILKKLAEHLDVSVDFLLGTETDNDCEEQQVEETDEFIKNFYDFGEEDCCQ